MYFQLLRGVHQEARPNRKVKAKTFKTEVLRNEKGEVVGMRQPVVESEKNLVTLFGPSKFRRVSDDEARFLLSQESVVDSNDAQSTTIPDDDTISPVAAAAARGAAALTEKVDLTAFGDDVTDLFKDNIAPNLLVFRKPGGRHYIIDINSGTPSVLNTEGAMKKADVVAFLKSYKQQGEE